MFASPMLRRCAATASSSSLRRTVVASSRAASTVATAGAARSAVRSASWLMAAGAGIATVAAYACSTAETVQAAAPQSGLDPKAFVPLKLAKRIHYNHNTDVFVFALADPNASLELPVASYIVTKFKGADGKDVMRPYTPIDQGEKGVVKLLIKTYPQGVMSKHIHDLKVGDELEIKGPLPKYSYAASSKKSLGFVAAGTGITPCLQVIEEVLNNPSDKTAVHLVFANTSSKDVLLKEQLDALAAKHASQLKVTYLVDKPEAGWTGPTGFVSADLLKKTLPAPSADAMVFVCGPPAFMVATSGGKTKDYKQGEVSGVLKSLGFDETNVFKF